MRITTGTCRHRSGENAEREELAKALDYLCTGDTLTVPSLDRLGCSIHDLITIVAGLRRRGIGFTSRHEALDTTTPGGRLIFHVFAALAVFIRELIVEATNEDLAAARARTAPASAHSHRHQGRSATPVTCSPGPRTPSHPSPNCPASPATPSTSTSPNSNRAAPRSPPYPSRAIGAAEARATVD